MAPQTREDVLPVRSDEAEKREAVLGTPRAHAPLDATANRHERRSRHPILDGTMSRDNAHASAQLGSRAVGGASGDGPRWRPRDAQAHFERMLPQRSSALRTDPTIRCLRVPFRELQGFLLRNDPVGSNVNHILIIRNQSNLLEQVDQHKGNDDLDLRGVRERT